MSELYAIITNDNHLEHHGIKGQKWGVRRYQNPDGSLTEEGKKRAHRDEYEKENPTLRGLRTARERVDKATIATGAAALTTAGAAIATAALTGGMAGLPLAALYAADFIGSYAVAGSLARIPLGATRGKMMRNRGISDYQVDKSKKKQEKQAWKEYDRQNR